MNAEFSTGNLLAMNEDFKRIGVWMDFENPYMSINNSYMEGEWWLVKRLLKTKGCMKERRQCTGASRAQLLWQSTSLNMKALMTLQYS